MYLSSTSLLPGYAAVKIEFQNCIEYGWYEGVECLPEEDAILAISQTLLFIEIE